MTIEDREDDDGTWPNGSSGDVDDAAAAWLAEVAIKTPDKDVAGFIYSSSFIGNF